MREVELHADRRRHPDDVPGRLIDDAELALGEQLDVFPVVRREEPLFGGERREHDLLQLLECVGILGLRTEDREACAESPERRHTSLRLPPSV